MALFVFTTDSCAAAAESHGLQEDLVRFRERIEKAQDYRQFDPFPPPYLVKKKFGGRQGRLVAALHNEVAGHTVVVLLAVMIRGDAAYEDHFSKNPVEYGHRHFDQLFSRPDLERFVRRRTFEDPPPEKPEPSAAEYGYIHQALSARPKSDREDFVCEGVDWVLRMGEAPFKNRLESIFAAVDRISGDEIVGGKRTVIDANGGLAIVTRSFPELKIRLLVAPFANGASPPLASVSQEILAADSPDLKLLLQASRRAYPTLLLADYDLWAELQKDTQANLALSPEETTLLDTARRAEGGFPLFINGRAGSGKTTILQYLFAEYLFYHLTAPERGPTPVYFTCNAELLSQSRRMVEKLLRCSAEWWDRTDRGRLVDESIGLIADAFREFRPHLLSLVPPSVRAAKFRPDRHVGYTQFKRLWHDRFGRDPVALRDYGPDIAWHVVRSYIKGLSAEVHLEPEEYRQLDQKQITVTQPTYERVYDKVWTRWYKNFSEDAEYWDDQDLARYLIENDLVAPSCSAVFCDEAQDFTRIELDLLLRSSIFSQRKLQANDVAHVPFVFAGDQFQTLNPTGFRWDAIKASFVEKFIMALDPERRSRLTDLNYQELTLNYRSSRSIVRFSNFVQALRSRLFDLPGLLPQQPWDRDIHPPPVSRIARESAEFWDRLKKEQDVAIIVPCGEGEELDYIAADPVLKHRIRIEDNIPDALVLSPSRAKGLEFNRVVVYGFGESPEARGELMHPLQGKESYAGDADKSLPFQYFINRLYVAVSRPKRRLFIVDSTEGFDRFWSFAQNDDVKRAILRGIKNGEEVWGKSVAELEFGRPDDLALDRAEDPKAQADALARQGRANTDAYLLRQAAASYRNLGDDLEADGCKAEALRIEQNYIEAARTFLRCGRVADAVDALWRAKRPGWAELVDAAENYPEINQRLEFAFALPLARALTLDLAQRALARLAERLKQPEGIVEVGSNLGWAEAARVLFEKLESLKLNQAEWGALAMAADGIAERVPLVSDRVRASLHYRAGSLARAVALWDRAGDTSGKEYKLAKALSASFPDRLVPLAELERYDDIVRECAEQPEIAVTGAPAGAAAKAYLRQGLLERALRYAAAGKESALSIQIAAAAVEANSLAVARRAVAITFAIAAERADHATFFAFVDRTALAKDRHSKALAAWLKENKLALTVHWMRALARTPSISELPWHDPNAKANLRPLSDFLGKTLFGNRRPSVPDPLLSDLGGAIELLGNRTDALAFYEWLRAHETGRGIARYAAERWVVCKERQAKFESARGDERLARIQQAEADETRRRIGLKQDAVLPAYPELSSPAELIHACLTEAFEAEATIAQTEAAISANLLKPTSAAQPPAQTDVSPTAPVESERTRELQRRTEVVLGALRIELFRDSAKLTVRNPATGAIASFKLGERTAQAIDATVEELAPGTPRWQVPEWGLTVDATAAASVAVHGAVEGATVVLLY
jgi:hypothetical protein